MTTTRIAKEQALRDSDHVDALIERAGLDPGDTVIVGRGNPVAPPQYRIARIDEINAQALIQPLDEADARDPWWVRIECLVKVRA